MNILSFFQLLTHPTVSSNKKLILCINLLLNGYLVQVFQILLSLKGLVIIELLKNRNKVIKLPKLIHKNRKPKCVGGKNQEHNSLFDPVKLEQYFIVSQNSVVCVAKINAYMVQLVLTLLIELISH